MEVEVRVIWEEERRSLTLEGEPVLEYALSWPRVEGAGLGGKWISRYYVRLAAGSGRSTGWPAWSWPATGKRPVPLPPGKGS